MAQGHCPQDGQWILYIVSIYDNINDQFLSCTRVGVVRCYQWNITTPDDFTSEVWQSWDMFYKQPSINAHFTHYSYNI